jgi:hypothetical protein
VPVFSYFFVVGSVLTGLLFYANSVMVPVALPFSVSQMNGLPRPYKAPVIVADVPNPVIVATTVEPRAEMKKPVKTVRKHKPAQVAGQSVLQGRYAAYPAREYGTTW